MDSSESGKLGQQTTYYVYVFVATGRSAESPQCVTRAVELGLNVLYYGPRLRSPQQTRGEAVLMNVQIQQQIHINALNMELLSVQKPNRVSFDNESLL